MRIVSHRLGRQHRPVVERVTRIADEAGRLAARHARSSLGRVELAVTTTKGIPDLICAAHERIFGTSDWDAWHEQGVAGCTTIRPGGSLVVINAEANRGCLDEADMTVIHELVHAAQVNRRGMWELVARGLAHNYGIEPMSDREVWAANLRRDRDEREAAAAERLHRQLAKAVA
ncbi:hypothetical protein [Streptomyces sp. NPDC050704]|uniref:hypothetical protein n=1 Tax=Streptomyces sp. NPDC050704 TaxID=3157219 RepID=UPI0034261A28